MIGFTPQNIGLTYSSIPLENLLLFDKNIAYLKGSEVRHGNYHFVALKDITPTVHYTWNSLNPSNKFGWDLYNDIQIPDPTKVPTVADVTIVWSIRNQKYYKAKHTQLTDFTIQDPLAPADFVDIGSNPNPLYRISLSYPIPKKDTTEWGYEGVLNRYIMFDGILNNQTRNSRSFTDLGSVNFNTNICSLSTPLSKDIYVEDKIKIVGTNLNNGYFKIVSIEPDRLSFTIDTTFEDEIITNVTFYAQTYIKFSNFGIDRIALFNTDCERVKVQYSVNGVEKINQIIEMSDYSFLTDFKTFCFNQPRKKGSEIVEFYPTFGQDFEITFFGDYQSIGEILIGTSVDLGIVEDSVSIDGKVYGTLEEASNGDLYSPTDLTQKDVLDRKQFTLVVDEEAKDTYMQRIKSLLGQKVVISGSQSQGDKQKMILTHGIIRDYNFNPRVNQEKNTYKFEIREFREWLQ